MKSNIEKIIEYKDQYPQLCHASNIIAKSKKGDKIAALQKIIEQYIKYLEGNLSLVGYTDDIIRKRVKLVNNYYNFIHNNNYDNLFTAQSKFRSTILEEFPFLLFKNFVEKYQTKYHANYKLESGSVNAYTNLYFKAKSFGDFVQNPEMGINVKDQDFAIYRKIEITQNDSNTINLLQVPAVAIEVKTYVDKTMLEGIIATAEKVKSGNPYSMFIVLTEAYDVTFDADPAYSRIDQIYVLRKSKSNEEQKTIDENVVLRMFHEIQRHLERPWSDVEARMRNEGVII